MTRRSRAGCGQCYEGYTTSIFRTEMRSLDKGHNKTTTSHLLLHSSAHIYPSQDLLFLPTLQASVSSQSLSLIATASLYTCPVKLANMPPSCRWKRFRSQKRYSPPVTLHNLVSQKSLPLQNVQISMSMGTGGTALLLLNRNFTHRFLNLPANKYTHTVRTHIDPIGRSPRRSRRTS